MSESLNRSQLDSRNRAILAGVVVFIVCFVVFCLLYFGTTKATEKNYMLIENGMTYHEVVGILGEPTPQSKIRRNPDADPVPGGEIWEGHDAGGDVTIQVFFDRPRGRVIAKRLGP